MSDIAIPPHPAASIKQPRHRRLPAPVLLDPHFLDATRAAADQIGSIATALLRADALASPSQCCPSLRVAIRVSARRLDDIAGTVGRIECDHLALQHQARRQAETIVELRDRPPIWWPAVRFGIAVGLAVAGVIAVVRWAV